MTVYAITDTKKGRTGIAPTYLQTTPKRLLSSYFFQHSTARPIILVFPILNIFAKFRRGPTTFLQLFGLDSYRRTSHLLLWRFSSATVLFTICRTLRVQYKFGVQRRRPRRYTSRRLSASLHWAVPDV